jgi:two-component system, chemotaxis family, sensor histidine kinase and response regulator WspE
MSAGHPSSTNNPLATNDVSQLSLLDLFCMEVSTQMAVFNHELLNLEITEDREQSLRSLMRAAHSIKGAARIVQVEIGVTIAHHLEDYFVKAQAGEVVPTTDHIDILLEGGDRLLGIAQTLEAGGKVEDNEAVQAYLKALTELLEPPKEPTQPAIIAPTATPEILSPAVSVEISEDLVIAFDAPILPEPLPIVPATVPTSPPQMEESRSVHEQRTVRVSAEHLHRLMDLAGEALVAVDALQVYADAFTQLKTQQAEINQMLGQMKSLLDEHQLGQEQANSSQLACHRILQEKLTLATQKANRSHQLLIDRQNAFETFSQKTGNLTDRLYRTVIASQMRPFSDISHGFPRLVRDVAKQLHKKVRLVMTGQTTLVDRDILDRLESPLTHLLSNAIDHGIESAEQRQLIGKEAHGTIYLEASHRAGMLHITVRDDGRGIEPEFLRRQIVYKQLTTAPMAAQMSEAELLEFLYLPGFSTAKNVTQISGRGVGLDIVRNMIQNVSGTIRTTTQPGQGTTFHLQLPLTLSVIRTLLVQIAGEAYAIPLSRVDRIITFNPEQVIFSENRPYILDVGEALGILAATEILGLPEPASPRQQYLSAIILHDRQHHYGLIIDRVLGEQNLVVRPLDQRLGKIPNISAAALLNDGTPLFIMDVDDLLRSIEKHLSQGQSNHVPNHIQAEQTTEIKRVLVVDDSITVREMERKLLENAGYQVDVAVDGMDGWNAVRTKSYDLVVTDVDMPRLSGIELVSQIKAEPSLQNIPTIIVSYKDREIDRLQGLEAGADYYLTKSSFHDDTLLQAVIDLIGQPQSPIVVI